MYIGAIVSTVVAWFIGLVIDANINFDQQGFLYLRVLFPIIVMGIFILSAINKNEKSSNTK